MKTNRFAHYDPDTGYIRQVSSNPFKVRGLKVAEYLGEFVPDTYKVDLKSVRHDEGLGWNVCDLVELDEQEKPKPPSPTLINLRAMRDAALAQSDVWAVSDRPMSEGVREAWRAYRQALRDLGAQKTVKDFASAWPLRPDGSDDIPDIRAAIEGA